MFMVRALKRFWQWITSEEYARRRAVIALLQSGMAIEDIRKYLSQVKDQNNNLT